VNVCAADLHVHTALSPCAENDMTPPAIVAKALSEGLGMIAVCDHNSARNAAAVQEVAGARLAVLAGMEITTVEECHVVALFPDAEAAEAAGAEVGATLGQVDDGYETFFGEQRVLAADGRERARETLALAPSTSFTGTAGSPSRRTSTAGASA
jgi:PHP family Zn ribbon phosphoesterase